MSVAADLPLRRPPSCRYLEGIREAGPRRPEEDSSAIRRPNRRVVRAGSGSQAGGGSAVEIQQPEVRVPAVDIEPFVRDSLLVRRELEAPVTDRLPDVF